MSAELAEAVARTRARLAHGDTCDEAVMRRGRGEPCGKPAVALRDDTEVDSYYAVCARHARGFCIPMVARGDAVALLDAAAERDALAAKLDAVRALAEHYAGLTNVDAGSGILRAIDATPETGGES